jgi:hypothetical protein
MLSLLAAASLGAAPAPLPLPRARLHAVAQQAAKLGEVRKTIHEVASLVASTYEHTNALEQPGVLTVSVRWMSVDDDHDHDNENASAAAAAAAAARATGCRVSFLRGEFLEKKLLLEAETAARRALEAGS